MGVSLFPKAGDIKFAELEHSETLGTNGGAISTGARDEMKINVEVSDLNSLVSLASNKFTLVAGKYIIQIECVTCQIEDHVLYLRDTTNSVDVTRSVYNCSDSAQSNNFMTSFVAYFTSTGVEALSLQIDSSGTTSVGQGRSRNLGAKEVYKKIRIFKIG